ncbi:MAG TPA: MBL fold metallo-hydrolase [Blastocatellia bacterium]|nr:MBL fold metallo-hydrolase [Blastocatellia bacterium]
MKLTIFQSDKGDCLLLEAASGELVLCDGGMRPSMRNYVRAELGALREEGRELEFVYISHIDNDHIGGVLQLLEDEIEWRVYDHHQQSGDPIKDPKVPRPPVIKGILHNGFRDMITANDKPIESLYAAKAIENLLAEMVPALFGTAVPDLVSMAESMQAIVTGVPEAIQVSKLIAADALDIPLNRPPGVTGPSRLLYAGRPGEVFDLGSMKFTLIGPTSKELSNLRDGWNNWLRENKARLKEIRAELKRRVDEFSTGALSGSPFDLREWEGIPGYKGVTVPNISSLMFLVEENGKRLLLTGDAQQDFIRKGLKRTGFLKGGYVHLDVLKVQHHGSEKNMDANFAREVSADHYVFCGNGEHENPDLGVIDIIRNSRLGNESVRALAPEAENREFHFWFSTTAAAQDENTKKREHFLKVEKKVQKLAAESNGLLKLHFNEDASIVLEI